MAPTSPNGSRPQMASPNGPIMDSERQYSLYEALVLGDIDFDEDIHDALVDARNTALLFAKMEMEEEFKFIS